MTCETFRARLVAFDLGELSPPEAAAAREHVSGCGECAAAVLRERQLAALLRASSVPAPASLRSAVTTALRTAAGPDRSPRHPNHAGSSPGELAPLQDLNRAGAERGRVRHWAVLAAALAGAAALSAVLVLQVPAPDRTTPLAAAWTAYAAGPVVERGQPPAGEAERLAVVLGRASHPPDLSKVGLRMLGAGERSLGGHLALVVEYRSETGDRVTLFRWRGRQPGPIPLMELEDYGAGGVEAARWGHTASLWWHRDGVVSCLVGTLDPEELNEVRSHVRGES